MSESAETGSTLRSPRRWLVAGGVVSVVGLLLILPIHAPGRWLGVLFDFAHLPVFAVLVFVVTRALGGSRPNWLLAAGVALAAGVFGLGAEFVQGLIGRSAEWSDAAANAVGASIGFVAATWSGWKRSLRAVAVITLMVMAAWAYVDTTTILTDVVRQRLEFPVLGSFENELELVRWRINIGRIARSAEHATDGVHSLRVDLDPGRYPGLMCRWPYNNWSGRSTLSFNVWNDSNKPLDVFVRVNDFAHNNDWVDRFERTVTLAPGANTVRIPLDDVRNAPSEREMDMSVITNLMVFTVDLEESRVLYFDRFELR